jgi:tetratricopeptide (TPR) repeat protein
MKGSITTSAKKAAISLLLFSDLQAVPARVYSQSPNSGQKAYSRAEELVRSHHWDEGLQILNRLLTTDPRNLKALNLAGIASSSRGDSQQADRYFERALKVDPRFLPALKNLSISEFNAHHYSLAEKHLSVAQQQLPDDVTINLYLGEIAYNDQKFSLAAERLSRASQFVKQDPKLNAQLAVSLLRSGQKQQALDLLDQIEPSEIDAQSQLALGLALADSDSNDQAVPYFTAAFATAPESYDAGFDLALACVRAKQYSTAIATMQELIGRSHDSSELENLLGEAYAASGLTSKALDAYRKAIALDPSDENNYLDLASLCMDHHAFGDGLKVIAVGLDVHPESSRLIFMRGVIEASQDNFDLAENDFQRSSKLNPQHDFGTVGLGALYLERGNSEQALKVTRSQLRQKPDDPSLLYLLGEGLLSSGAAPGQPAYAEAQESLEKSVKINPSLCLPHVSLGSIYLREERYSNAAAQFEAARAIDPTENSAYSHLAVAYRHLGQQEKTKEVLSALKALLERERSGAWSQVKVPVAGESQ